MGEPELIEARLRHGYDISKICARKYRLLTVAFRTGMLSLWSGSRSSCFLLSPRRPVTRRESYVSDQPTSS